MILLLAMFAFLSCPRGGARFAAINPANPQDVVWGCVEMQIEIKPSPAPSPAIEETT